jgi:hypothetical protein
MHGSRRAQAPPGVRDDYRDQRCAPTPQLRTILSRSSQRSSAAPPRYLVCSVNGAVGAVLVSDSHLHD